MIIEIKVVEVVGHGLCVSSEDGQKLFDQINKNFKERQKVKLYFQDVSNLTSAFLNTAIGQLYGNFSEDFIKENLSVGYIEDDDAVILKRVVNRAKDYFRNPKPYEKAVKDVIGDNNG